MPRAKKQSDQPFARILKSVMKERGLKLADIANMAGVSVSVASDWTAGTTPSDMKKVKALAEGLELPMAFLLTGEHETVSKSKIPSLAEVLTEAEKFEGIYRISVQRLVPTGKDEKK